MGGCCTGPVRLQQLLNVAAPAQRKRPGSHRPAAQASQLHPQPRPWRPPTQGSNVGFRGPLAVAEAPQLHPQPRPWRPPTLKVGMLDIKRPLASGTGRAASPTAGVPGGHLHGKCNYYLSACPHYDLHAHAHSQALMAALSRHARSNVSQ